MLCFETRAVSDIGNKREINQDSYYSNIEYINDKYVGIFCVADGMGGLAEGEYASMLAVRNTRRWFESNKEKLGKKVISEKWLKISLKTLFYNINAEILAYGKNRAIKVGTTYSMLLLIEDKYYVVHAGDSRIYFKRVDKMYMLTKDQTWVNEQVESGFMTPEQAKHHPKKNMLANCLGCFEYPSICTGNGEVFLGDSFLLCSDGLYNLVTLNEISDGMSCDDLEYTVTRLTELVKQRGAFDNITAILVRITDFTEGENTTVEI